VCSHICHPRHTAESDFTAVQNTDTAGCPRARTKCDVVADDQPTCRHTGKIGNARGRQGHGCAGSRIRRARDRCGGWPGSRRGRHGSVRSSYGRSSGTAAGKGRALCLGDDGSLPPESLPNDRRCLNVCSSKFLDGHRAPTGWLAHMAARRRGAAAEFPGHEIAGTQHTDRGKKQDDYDAPEKDIVDPGPSLRLSAWSQGRPGQRGLLARSSEIIAGRSPLADVVAMGPERRDQYCPSNRCREFEALACELTKNRNSNNRMIGGSETYEPCMGIVPAAGRRAGFAGHSNSSYLSQVPRARLDYEFHSPGNLSGCSFAHHPGQCVWPESHLDATLPVLQIANEMGGHEHAAIRHRCCDERHLERSHLVYFRAKRALCEL
jgi:hypothetical protein